MKKLFLILFSTVLFSCMDPQDTDFSTYEDGTAIEYYSFDGDFSLSQNCIVRETFLMIMNVLNWNIAIYQRKIL